MFIAPGATNSLRMLRPFPLNLLHSWNVSSNQGQESGRESGRDQPIWLRFHSRKRLARAKATKASPSATEERRKSGTVPTRPDLQTQSDDPTRPPDQKRIFLRKFFALYEMSLYSMSFSNSLILEGEYGFLTPSTPSDLNMKKDSLSSIFDTSTL